jgi:hypothetical protein
VKGSSVLRRSVFSRGHLVADAQLHVMAKERKISVLIKSAAELSSQNRNSNPYVLICVNGNVSNVVAKTKPAKGSSSNPIWNETFKLTKEELFITGAPPSTLSFYVMDGDTTALGNVSIPFEKISDKDTPVDGAFPLSQGAGQLSITVATRSDIASMISGNYGTIAMGAAAALATAGLAALAVHEVNDYRENKEKLKHDETGRPASATGGGHGGGAAAAYGGGAGTGHAGAYGGTSVASGLAAGTADGYGRTGYTGEQRTDQDEIYGEHTGSGYAGNAGTGHGSGYGTGGNAGTGYGPGGSVGTGYGPGGNAGTGYGSDGNSGTGYGAGATTGGGYGESGRYNRTGYGEDGNEGTGYGAGGRTATDGEYGSAGGYSGGAQRVGHQIAEEASYGTGVNYKDGGRTGSHGGGGRNAELGTGQYSAGDGRGRHASNVTDYDAGGYGGTERTQNFDGEGGGYRASAYGGGERTVRNGGEDGRYGGDTNNASEYDRINRTGTYGGEAGGYGNEGYGGPRGAERDGNHGGTHGVSQQNQHHNSQSWWDNDSNDSIDEEEERRELESRLVGGQYGSAIGGGSQYSTSSYETAASRLEDGDGRNNRQGYQESRQDNGEDGRYY